MLTIGEGDRLINQKLLRRKERANVTNKKKIGSVHIEYRVQDAMNAKLEVLNKFRR